MLVMDSIILGFGGLGLLHDKRFECISAVLEIAEGIIACCSRGEEADMTRTGVPIAPTDNGIVIAFDKNMASKSGVFCSTCPLSKHAGSGTANEDKVGNFAPRAGTVGKVVGQTGVVDASVETAKNERVDLLECFNGSNGSFGNGGDGIVVESDALPGTNKFKPMW